MIIRHNMAAMNVQRMLKVNEKKREGIAEKLSSGYRINRSADDAAGLAIWNAAIFRMAAGNYGKFGPGTAYSVDDGNKLQLNLPSGMRIWQIRWSLMPTATFFRR